MKFLIMRRIQLFMNSLTVQGCSNLISRYKLDFCRPLFLGIPEKVFEMTNTNQSDSLSILMSLS